MCCGDQIEDDAAGKSVAIMGELFTEMASLFPDEQARPALVGSWDTFLERALPDSNAICCMLNHRRRPTLPRPTAAPTVTQLRVDLTLHLLSLRADAYRVRRDRRRPALHTGQHEEL